MAVGASLPWGCKLTLLACGVLFLALSGPAHAQTCSGGKSLVVQRLGGVANGFTGTGTVETLTYDPVRKVAIVVEARPEATTSLWFVDLSDPSNPTTARRILVGPSANDNTTGSPNSAAVYKDLLAVGLDARVQTDRGFVRLYDVATGAELASAEVCALPDMVTWSQNGKAIYVACEGEPSTQGDASTGSDPNVGVNPTGKFGIVYVNKNGEQYSLEVKLLDFKQYIDSLSDAQYRSLLDRGMYIDPRVPKASAAKDIEPEYIALSDDGKRAYVTLQENNAIAEIDLTNGRERIRSIWPIPTKNWAKLRIDTSDRDGPRLRTYANLYSSCQPDTIVHRNIYGKRYLFVACEGDSKEEGKRVKDLTALDPLAFPNATLLADSELGRLTVNPLRGIKGGYNSSLAWDRQGPYDKLYMYGSRSFAILDASNGKLVYESSDLLERITINNPLSRQCFNCDRSGDVSTADSRSDNAGPEPEALEVFKATTRKGKDRYYVAVGLERQSGFMLFDVTKPSKPKFLSYTTNRNYTATAVSQQGDLAPEGIRYVGKGGSAIGSPLLLVSNELSGSLAVYRIKTCT